MSVENVYQLLEESGNQDADRTESDLTYRVMTDDPATPAADVLSASVDGMSIPDVGDEVGDSRVVSKDYRRDADNPNLFTVTCKLSDADPDAEQPTGDEKVNASIKVSTVVYEEPVYLDRDDKPIVNTAGQPFSNQPTKCYYDERITVSFRTGTVDQTNIDKCRGNVNSDVINLNVRGYRRTFAVGTLRLVDTPISSVVVRGQYCWDVEYVMDYRADGWTRKILSTGAMQKGNAGQPRLIKIDLGDTAISDVPLDMNGKAILDGLIAVAKPLDGTGDNAPSPGDRVYIKFKIDKEAAYGPLLSGVG